VKPADLTRWGTYFDLRDSGMGVGDAARRSRVSASAAYRFERGDPSATGAIAADLLGITMVGGEPVVAPLSDEARRALTDFAYFRLRYFGRTSTPWQVQAAEAIEQSLHTKTKDRIVINAPPGTGKSTLFTCDLICWLIARDRTIRIMIGSRTLAQAKLYVTRIKRALERDVPITASLDDIEDGIAADAQAALSIDYGQFKPPGRSDKWRADGLVVRQLDGVSLDDKEDTVAAAGQDTGFLGGRYDVVLWDDLSDSHNNKTEEGRTSMHHWWDTESEPRVEPGGVFVLQGQRLSPNDLYRYCLDKKKANGEPKYRHIIYKAHYEDRCTGSHDDVKPYPVGCLLDPYRLPWEELADIRDDNNRLFQTVYQQEDGDGTGGLAEKAWIEGGFDSQGYPAPGCLDKDRRFWEFPPHLRDHESWSFVTVDPSPTKYWGIIWWLYDPATGNRYIIDMVRKALAAPDFLSVDIDTGQFSGLIFDWHGTALGLGIPLRHVIVETNAGQRWLLQDRAVQKWQQMTGVIFVPHTTGVNKADPKFGLKSIADLFRQGQIRIPWAGIAERKRMGDFIDEATKFPDWDTDDLMMSTWFGKLGVENHYTPGNSGQYRMNRPSALLTGTRRGMW
jgi:hypothetical protein